MRKWEIVRPESGEESGIGARILCRAQRQVNLRWGWSCPSVLGFKHEESERIGQPATLVLRTRRDSRNQRAQEIAAHPEV
jgi:hypothetical protein